MARRPRSRRPTLPPADGPQDCYRYVRVSTDDQEEYSPDAQRGSTGAHEVREQLTCVEEFADSHSARLAGKRPEFARMLAKLRRGPVRVVVFDKVDRSTRNLRDYADLDDLVQAGRIEVHFAREGLIVRQHGTRGAKLLWGVLVQIAKDFSENLAEEVMKGLRQKQKLGRWPGSAPIGYLNVEHEGAKIIVPDPERAHLVRDLFERCAAGAAVVELTAHAQAIGLRTRPTKRHPAGPVSRAHVASLLRHGIYCGDVTWGGQTTPGTHEPLVSRATWQAAQRALDGRRTGGRRVRGEGREHEFSGLVTCAHCGCSLVGTTKRGGSWIAYRCSGMRGACGEPYVTERDLREAVARGLDELQAGAVLGVLVRDELLAALADEDAFRAKQAQRIRLELDALEKRLRALLLEVLDGRMSRAEHDTLAEGWRAEQARLRAELAGADRERAAHADALVRVYALASQVATAYRSREDVGLRRAILEAVAARTTWGAGQLTLELAEPFCYLADTPRSGEGRPAWWGGLDEIGTWLGGLTQEDAAALAESLRALEASFAA